MVIRTAIIGFGTAGRFFHAPFLAADPEFRIDVIVTADPERAAQAAQEHPQARVIADAESVWTEAAIDLVVVASPSGTHGALTDAALRSGHHVVVDKPFVADPAEGEALIALAASQGRVLTVFHNRRWDGDFRTVRELVRSGRLGEIRRFESRFEWWQPAPRPGWKSDSSVAEGGGILFDLGPHLIDQALQLFGPVREMHSEVTRARDSGAADDDAFLALHHHSGVRSHLWMSAVAPAPGPRFHVLGSEAGYTSWGLDGQEPALRDGRRPGDPGFGETPEERWGIVRTGDLSERVPTARGAYGDFYSDLAVAITSGSLPPVDPADAVQGLRLIAEAHENARPRRTDAS